MKKLNKIFLKIFSIGLVVFLYPIAIILKAYMEKPYKLHKKKKYNEALMSYRKRLRLYQKAESKDKKIYGEFLFNIGLIYKIKNDKQTADIYFQKAKEKGIKEDPDKFNGEEPLIIIRESK